MDILFWIILACLVNGLTAFIGAISLLFSKDFLHKTLLVLVAFSAGALLAGAFFHLIPEALNTLSEYWAFGLVMIGFTIFFLMEKFLWHHCHEENCAHAFNYLVLYGDALHNFIDGLIIAASFVISVPFGIITTLLVLAHEIPHELGNFAVLVYGGFSRRKSLIYNFISQMVSLLGGILGFFFAGLSGFATYLVPIAAGGFIYISASDLIPELKKEENWKKYLCYLAAFIIGALLILLFKMYLEY